MRRPIPVKLGPFSMGASNVPAGSLGSIDFGTLPPQIQRGVGMVTEIEVRLDATIATRANDPAVPSYMLDRLVDQRLEGPGGIVFADHKGWHRAPREWLQIGKLTGFVPADLPATGGAPGSYTRTLTKRFKFVEPFMAQPLARCLPAAFWAKYGKYRPFPYNTAQIVGGAGISLTALNITIFVYVLDVDPKTVPIGIIAQEGYAAGLTDVKPTPGKGQYLRLMGVNDPAMAVTSDDLGAYTTVDFGVQSNYSQFQRDVSELVRAFDDEFAVEPHRPTNAAFTGQKEEFRFGDPIENASGRLHLIPLVYPHKGANLRDCPSWLGAVDPVLRANYDSRAGLPTSIDFLYDRIASRDVSIVEAAISAVNPAAWKRFPGVQRAVAAEYRGARDVSRVPLVVDCS